MRLDPAILEELAAFYARRLPDGADAIAKQCGLPAPGGTGVDAWRALLTAADSRVHKVANAVARSLPADENAQQAAKDLAPNRTWAVGAAVAASLAVLLVIGIVASSSNAQAEIAPPARQPAAPLTMTAPPVATAAPLEPVALAPAPSAVTPETTAPAAPTAPPVPVAQVPASESPTLASLAPSTKVPRSGCHAAEGATVGWWYAGAAAPGSAGETITLKRGANVRASAPSAENHWRLGAPVGCGLEAGDRVTLGEVRAIPGGVWVELRG